eukprot:Em0009g267a
MIKDRGRCRSVGTTFSYGTSPDTVIPSQCLILVTTAGEVGVAHVNNLENMLGFTPERGHAITAAHNGQFFMLELVLTALQCDTSIFSSYAEEDHMRRLVNICLMRLRQQSMDTVPSFTGPPNISTDSFEFHQLQFPQDSAGDQELEQELEQELDQDYR